MHTGRPPCCRHEPTGTSPRASPSTPAVPFGPDRPVARRRILIIEDNRDAADSLRLFLEIVGYEVQVAYTGPEGVRAAQRWGPEVVLSDIGLPGLDGYEVARALQLNPETASVRLIAVTGYGSAEALRLSRDAGFEHHLVKPVDPADLLPLLAGPGAGAHKAVG